MSFLQHLKRSSNHIDTRWVVKQNSKGFIREVKQVFNPEEYKKFKNSRVLLNKEELIKILEEDKNKKMK